MLSTFGALVLAMAAPAMSQVREDRPVPALTVSGSAEARVQPDLATIRIGVVAQAKTAKAAQNEASAKANEFIARARRLLGDRGTVETGHIALHPVYTQQPPRPMEPFVPQIEGYRAENTLVVRTSDFALVGPVVDAAVEAGMNNVESVVFGLKDDRRARLDALREAVREATEKAKTMAEAAGIELAGVWEITESNARVIPFMPGRAAAMAEAAPTPVLPGTVSVNAEVTVRYFIRPRG